MKNICTKISKVLKFIFGIGITVSLFAGGLSFFGYLAAIIIGGNTAAVICAVIYDKIIPIMIYISTVTVLLGIVAMYFAGEYALTSEKREKTKQKD